MAGKGKPKTVIILSGGLDSTTLLYYLVNFRKEVYAISFDYGQKHKKELNCAIATCKHLNVNHKVIDFGIFNELAPSAITRKDWKVPEGHYQSHSMKQTVVPNRNMVMLALATSYAISIGAKYVYYGAHAGDHYIYADCRPAFIRAMSRAIQLCDDEKVRLVAPFQRIKKGDIVKIGLTMGVDYKLTWTCYNGLQKACGKCGSCVERLEAFKENNAIDPLEYELK